jgi:hypothetical protein
MHRDDMAAFVDSLGDHPDILTINDQIFLRQAVMNGDDGRPPKLLNYLLSCKTPIVEPTFRMMAVSEMHGSIVV